MALKAKKTFQSNEFGLVRIGDTLEEGKLTKDVLTHYEQCGFVEVVEVKKAPAPRNRKPAAPKETK